MFFVTNSFNQFFWKTKDNISNFVYRALHVWQLVYAIKHHNFCLNSFTKGQLISECLFGVIDFPKKQRKIWQISALESKKLV